MAHITASLAAARHALLDRSGWNVEERRLNGAPPIRILSSDQRHGTFERAVRLLGLGTAKIEYLAAGSDGGLPPDALAEALAKNDLPAIVLLQAGEINTGAYDRFADLIPIARRHDAWVHVDGAFGLWAAASPRFRHLTEGVELADSWATDGHKWLNVPHDSGYAFVAHPEPHRASMSHRAAYLTHAETARDELDWNPDWSRRARGFATYAALRELGRNGVAAMIERCCDHAREIVDGIGRLPGAEVLWRPAINQGLVRFTDDRRTDEAIAAIARTGEAFFTGTTWRGCGPWGERLQLADQRGRRPPRGERGRACCCSARHVCYVGRLISFSNINKQYGKQVIFVDASFQLNPGEKVGWWGRTVPARLRSFAWWWARKSPMKARSPFPRS